MQAVVLLGLVVQTAAAAASRPHIVRVLRSAPTSTRDVALASNRPWSIPSTFQVLALVDDWGWANFGPHRTNATDAELEGSQETHTPILDQLVKDGVLLDRHYAYKICSPSRSSLQSGRLAVHVNTENKAVSTYNASDPVRTAMHSAAVTGWFRSYSRCWAGADVGDPGADVDIGFGVRGHPAEHDRHRREAPSRRLPDGNEREGAGCIHPPRSAVGRADGRRTPEA